MPTTAYIKRFPVLTPAEITHIKNLFEVSAKYDGFETKCYWQALLKRTGEYYGDFCFYLGEKLIGYLGLFWFNEDSIEVSVLVHPEHRQQGVFKLLLQEAQEELQRLSISCLTFPIHAHSVIGSQLSQRYKLSFIQAEYKLTLDLKKALPEIDSAEEFKLTLAGKKQLNQILSIDQACFGCDKNLMRNPIEASLEEKNRQILFLKKRNTLLGKIHLRFDQDAVFLHDVSILPKFQGQGLGKLLLSLTFRYLQENHPLFLHAEIEVFSNNPKALKLYQSCGFSIKDTYEYWRLNLDIN